MVSKEHNRGNKMYSNAITQVLEKEHKNEPTLIQERTYDAIRNGANCRNWWSRHYFRTNH